jgi:hypothetical protein
MAPINYVSDYLPLPQSITYPIAVSISKVSYRDSDLIQAIELTSLVAMAQIAASVDSLLYLIEFTIRKLEETALFIIYNILTLISGIVSPSLTFESFDTTRVTSNLYFSCGLIYQTFLRVFNKEALNFDLIEVKHFHKQQAFYSSEFYKYATKELGLSLRLCPYLFSDKVHWCFYMKAKNGFELKTHQDLLQFFTKLEALKNQSCDPLTDLENKSIDELKKDMIVWILVQLSDKEKKEGFLRKIYASSPDASVSKADFQRVAGDSFDAYKNQISAIFRDCLWHPDLNSLFSKLGG